MYRYLMMSGIYPGRMRSILTVISAGLVCTSCLVERETGWVQQNAVEISSVDPENTDYTDLELLRSAIGEAHLVLLGEQEHGDGSAYLAKSRIVKFLHKEMGFNILAFEADFFGVNKAWYDYKAGKKSFNTVLEQMYIFWQQSEMCRDLFEYIERSQETHDPMVLAGFDAQLLSTISKTELVPSLDSMLQRHDVPIGDHDLHFFRTTLKEAMDRFHDQEITPEEQLRFFNILRSIRDELKDKKIDPFRAQELDNIEGFMKHTWYWWIDRENDMVDNNYRDFQMAKNSLWLLNKKYRGNKVILWAANGHIAKTDTLYDVEREGWKPEIRQYPMGEVLYDSLGDKMYSIGFVTYNGRGTTLRYSPEAKDFLFLPYPFERADSSCLEYEFRKTGYSYAFLDLKGRSGHWSDISLRMRIWRPEYVKGRLPDIYDGIFYIEEMQPNKKIK